MAVGLLAILLGIALASSVDNFGVAVTYGLRRVHIPWDANGIIALVAFLLSWAGITSGLWLASLLPGIVPALLGALILFFIGLRILLLALPHRPSPGEPPSLWRTLITPPQNATIGWGETILLGVALSANALTNGVAAGLIGISPLLLSLLTAVGSFISVALGVRAGKKASTLKVGRIEIGQYGTLISGVLLMLLAALAIWA
ncbi:MAG: manganese efflux pump [Bacillota bacterium]|nr:manganese efflux pump [Bacillota bacterium]